MGLSCQSSTKKKMMHNNSRMKNVHSVCVSKPKKLEKNKEEDDDDDA